MKRQIIRIDEELCTGCGECVPSCAEGAIQIIDGKARLVKDALCDGLGACLGECPEGALTIEEREADEFDEELVEEHLEKLKEPKKPAHPLGGATGASSILFRQEHRGHGHGGGCPGSQPMTFVEPTSPSGEEGTRQSQLRQWPVQLHLISPNAQYFQGADVVLCADCVPFAMADFHKDYLKGRSLAIACPKLDAGQDVYLQKLVAMIDEARINTLTVLIMQVPCCSGLTHLAQRAVSLAKRKVPIKVVVVGLRGEVLSEDWA